MIWPTNLVTCALFNTLHSQQYAGIGNRGGLSRERFFCYAFAGSLCWYFFPAYIFQALSYFSWVCWIVPDNVVVNQLFGYNHGLGMSLITFDWAQVCLLVPILGGLAVHLLTNSIDRVHRISAHYALGGLRRMSPLASCYFSGSLLPSSTTRTPGTPNFSPSPRARPMTTAACHTTSRVSSPPSPHSTLRHTSFTRLCSCQRLLRYHMACRSRLLPQPSCTRYCTSENKYMCSRAALCPSSLTFMLG